MCSRLFRRAAAYGQPVSVTVLPYPTAWPVLFHEEAARLQVALAPWLVEGVHHIGSTAVPGLAAKPIIDMIAGVHDLRQAQQALPVLGELGYQHADHRPHEALWFSKAAEPSTRTSQLHLTQTDSALWLERLDLPGRSARRCATGGGVPGPEAAAGRQQRGPRRLHPRQARVRLGGAGAGRGRTR